MKDITVSLYASDEEFTAALRTLRHQREAEDAERLKFRLKQLRHAGIDVQLDSLTRYVSLRYDHGDGLVTFAQITLSTLVSERYNPVTNIIRSITKDAFQGAKNDHTDATSTDR